MLGRPHHRGFAGSVILAALVLAVLVPGRTARAFDASEIEAALTTVGSGFASPILVANAGDGSGRLFVVEQGGRVRTLAGGAAGTPFLDIHTRVKSGGEQGLLGLAFHPEFETNGKLYVNYTRADDGATVIDEYRVTSDPDDVDETATRRSILAIAQPYSNHNGGNIAFGPDGYLYIGMGDGGSAATPRTAPRTSTATSARCSESTSTGRRPERRTGFRRPIRTSAAPASTRSGRSGCATRGAGHSIG
jgi:glucose/arabinose dehydrogenase